MVEIRDREDLERWLDDKPAEVARVMALRAALRVLPLANARGEGFDLTPAVLRSLFISWARFKAERLADQADWVIWIQWYERRLSGDRLGWDIDPDQHEALCWLGAGEQHVLGSTGCRGECRDISKSRSGALAAATGRVGRTIRTGYR